MTTRCESPVVRVVARTTADASEGQGQGQGKVRVRVRIPDHIIEALAFIIDYIFNIFRIDNVNRH